MSDHPVPQDAADRRPGRGRFRLVLWGALAVVLLMLTAGAWIGVRGLAAKNDLQRVQSDVTVLRDQIAKGDVRSARSTAEAVQRDAAHARSMTGDPVWAAAQYLPLVGGNFRAVRDVSAVIDDVASGAVVPAVEAIDGVGADAFRAEGGRVDLEPLVAARPAVARASSVLNRAERAADRIDTSGALSPVVDAVRTLRTSISSVAAQATAADRVLTLAPEMLGADGPRHYLVLFQNNAELRAGGGIPGAVAMLNVDDGAVSLGRQASTADFPQTEAPVLALDTDTRGLYGDITGQFIQDVTLTPRFDTSARLASEMWRQRFGDRVDGVVALDPVTLGYILRATGPVPVASGDELTADNAVSLLLSEAYAKYPDPRAQDAFFASAAQAVFERVAGGGFDTPMFVAALEQGAREDRIKVWSALDDEQAQLADSAVGGALPESGGDVQRFGVYLNDATGAKMDYYLEKSVAVGSQVCRKDGRPTWALEVTLKNTAPADAGSTLPEYVTGGRAFGVDPGSVRTNVAVYAPPGAVFLGAGQDGRPAAPQTATDDEHSVVQLSTELAPGRSTTIRVEFLGERAYASTPVDADSTPGVRSTAVEPLAGVCTG